MTRDYAKQRQKYEIINLLPRLPKYFRPKLMENLKISIYITGEIFKYLLDILERIQVIELGLSSDYINYIFIIRVFQLIANNSTQKTINFQKQRQKNFSKRGEEPDGFYRLRLTYEENVCEFIITDRIGLSPSVEYIVILCAFLEGFQVTERIHIIHMPVVMRISDRMQENHTKYSNRQNIQLNN
ncbi:hypothetical protein AGLY_012483 [Aphis glycines]|uniref:Uncharacterized protein n=1 Tax=Aphis glycines TaxID=307491 RepID=A0A6G0T8G2_APHGL|nr:hypothetical protein AGLY_012483 [Aphis glycines]